MMSLNEVIKRLPDDALSYFQNLFSPSDYNKLLLSFRVRRKSTFRVNTLKATRNQILNALKKLNINTQPISGIADGFALNDDKDFKKLFNSELTRKGYVYFQSISSMLPPVILKPEKGEKVLDLAAAPGSKTTFMSAMMKNTGSIMAVEPDFVRMERLQHNTKVLGSTNLEFFHGKGQHFCRDHNGMFDKVLADVPCSGEGRFTVYDKKSYGLWKQRNVYKLANLQKRLLKGAIQAARPGGMILYSTCTLNVDENEAVLDAVLTDPELSVSTFDIPQEFMDYVECIPPFTEYGDKKLHSGVKRAMRILPSVRMEGFFIALLMRELDL